MKWKRGQVLVVGQFEKSLTAETQRDAEGALRKDSTISALSQRLSASAAVNYNFPAIHLQIDLLPKSSLTLFSFRELTVILNPMKEQKWKSRTKRDLMIE